MAKILFGTFTKPVYYFFSISGIILILSFFGYSEGLTRPFIIITSSEYSAQQAKASQWPWSTMKTKAIDNATNAVYDSTVDVRTEGPQAQLIIGALALSYILDEDNRATYVNRFETDGAEMLWDLKRDKSAVYNTSADDVGYNSILGGAVFMAYIALDIMYDDSNFDPVARDSIEARCNWLVDKHSPTSWVESTYSLRGLKELYHNGKTATFETNKDSYKNAILHETTSNGVFCPGPGYTSARLFADERPQKKLFMDICEYQGYNEFYSNSTFIALHEWMAGYSRSTVKRTYSFSDASPSSYIGWTAATLRLFRFSSEAMEYMIFNQSQAYNDDSDVEGRLFHYLLTETVDGTPKEPNDFTEPTYGPPDRVFNNGGAFFRSENKRFKWKEAVGGAMWNVNPEEEVAHQHKDVNAVHITGYGENVIRNSGYDGWNEPDNGGSTWDWIHNTAKSSNTVIINNTDHVGKEGDGITESIIDDKFSFASGYSGDALGNGYHQRNFIMVKPQTGINPYFVVFDEVTVNTAGHSVQAFWHPATESDPTITNTDELFEFTDLKANIAGYDVDVSILLVNKPSSVSMNDGYLGGSSSSFQYTGRYLAADYPSANSFASFGTVIFPEHSTIVANSLTRYTGANFCAGVIDHGNNIIDYAISSDGSSSISYSNTTFIGYSTLYRENNGVNDFFIVRKGTKFINSQSDNLGFESDNPITIHMENDTGTVISPGTNVKFYHTTAGGITLNGEAKQLLDSGSGWIEVNVPSGQYSFELTETDQSLPVELSYFGIKQIKSDCIVLEWITESEIDNLGFIIERRDSKNEWLEIASYVTYPELVGQGSITRRTEYYYSDNAVESGSIYDYRIADISLDGVKKNHSIQLTDISLATALPAEFSLLQNHPNPFNSSTTIKFGLPSEADVTLEVFDINGRKIEMLLSGRYVPGYHYFTWNASNLASGVYFYHLIINQGAGVPLLKSHYVRKCLLMK